MYKKLTFTLLTAFLIGLPSLRAQYDFAAKTKEGQTLYYQILDSGDSVRVTHPEQEWPYYTDNKPVGKLTIPEITTYDGKSYRVVEIGANAFYRCDSLTEVQAHSIRCVGTQAFCGCTQLETFDFQHHLIHIGEGSFAYCQALKSVNLPGNLKSIGISAFSMCTGLQEVLIHPDAERLCDATTFHGCPLMEKVENRKKHESGWLFWGKKNKPDKILSN